MFGSSGLIFSECLDLQLGFWMILKKMGQYIFWEGEMGDQKVQWMG